MPSQSTATTLTVQGVEIPKLSFGTWEITGPAASAAAERGRIAALARDGRVRAFTRVAAGVRTSPGHTCGAGLRSRIAGGAGGARCDP